MLRNQKAKWVQICWVVPVLLILGLSAHPVEGVEQTIKIGVLGPMKFKTGEMFWNAASLAAEEINEAGGILVGKTRRPIELIRVDTNELLSVPDAVMATERVITVDKADILIGVQRTEASLAIQDVAMDYKKVFINTIANHPDLSERVAKDYDRYKYYFRLWLPITFHSAFVNCAVTEVAADAIRKELGIKTPKVAILAEKVAHADLVVQVSQELLPKNGMEIVGVWRPSQIAKDVTAELSAIKGAGAHIIQTTTSGPVGIAFSKTLAEMKLPVAATGWNVDAMDPRFWKVTGGKGEYEATWSGLGRVKITDKTIPFWDKYYARYTSNTAADYDALYVLKVAIEKAGTLDPDALVVQLEKTDYIGALGRMVFSKRGTPYPHNITFGPGYATGVGVQWIDGKQVVFWPHGRTTLGDETWVGVRYEGTKSYVLPPWMKEYWKGKK